MVPMAHDQFPAREPRKAVRPVLALLALGCACLLAAAAPAQQRITLSWTSKKAEGSPISVNAPTHVVIEITDVNDFLYTYRGFVTAEPMQLPGAPAIKFAGQLPEGCEPVATTVRGIIKTWTTSWQLDPWLDKEGHKVKSPNSVSVQATEEFYKNEIEMPLRELLRGNPKPESCDIADWAGLKAKYDEWEKRMASPHTYSMDATLEPLNNYTIHLSEYAYDENHDPQLTNACTQNGTPTECTIQYQPSNDILSASGGYLLSELQSRSYDRVNVPGSTDAVLGVGGTGRVSSVLAALVNVRIPCFWGSGTGRYIPPCSPHEDEWGWALSAGPVLQLGGSGETTRAGLFAGISLHLWKYVYLTPGVHIGEFADFPAGFTRSGQDIPSSFTSPLTPRTRTSARFGFAITFKGFSFGSSKGSGQLQGKNNTTP